ncbi:MAG: anthranilate synthase component II [Bacteroidetes bacterium]|nr:MAG: anthranilate synthase component II [Bacteroidota bacterium]
MQVLIIDNNDSFTYNIVNILRNIENVNFDVLLTNKISIDTLQSYDKIIISPGPGKPCDFPLLNDVITCCIKTKKPLLGVCLGHQTICEYFGGELVQLKSVIHGQKHLVQINNNSYIYKSLPANIEVGLYHSWTINPKTLPNCLEITGITSDKRLMSIKHKEYDIYGLQFHPESFMTKYGNKILENFIKI